MTSWKLKKLERIMAAEANDKSWDGKKLMRISKLIDHEILKYNAVSTISK